MSWLKCSKYDHPQEEIKCVCINKNCALPACCCAKCLVEHQNHEFADIIVIREQAKAYLEVLDEIQKKCSALSQMFNKWDQDIFNLVTLIQGNLKMPEYPSLNELEVSVKYLRERIDSQQLRALLKVYNDPIGDIQQNMQHLIEQTTNYHQNKTILIVIQGPYFYQQAQNIHELQLQDQKKELKRSIKELENKLEQCETNQKNMEKINSKMQLELAELASLREKIKRKKEKSQELKKSIQQMKIEIKNKNQNIKELSQKLQESNQNIQEIRQE